VVALGRLLLASTLGLPNAVSQVRYGSCTLCLQAAGDFRGGRPGGYRDRYDDRRGGYGGGRRDDARGAPRAYEDSERRGYGGGRRERDDGYGSGSGSRNIDRYESRRDDGYGAPRERRGGAYYRDEERDRGYAAPPPRDAAPRESYGARSYDREDRYAGR